MRLIRAGERDGTGGKTGSQFSGSVFNYLAMGGYLLLRRRAERWQR